jgi:hypothetical protein
MRGAHFCRSMAHIPGYERHVALSVLVVAISGSLRSETHNLRCGEVQITAVLFRGIVFSGNDYTDQPFIHDVRQGLQLLGRGPAQYFKTQGKGFEGRDCVMKKFHSDVGLVFIRAGDDKPAGAALFSQSHFVGLPYEAYRFRTGNRAGNFRRRDHALMLIQPYMRLVLADSARGSTTSRAIPFFCAWIPSDLFVFHLFIRDSEMNLSRARMSSTRVERG